MTDLRQAAQQALDALEAKGDAWIVLERKAIISLRAALAETTQEPHDYRFRYDKSCYKCKSIYCPADCKDTATPQQQAEPSMWGSGDGYWILAEDKTARPDKELFNIPFYITPPQRKWVGLTDEQKQDLVMDWFEGDWEVKKALWLLGDYEAKLKERNT